MYVISCDYNRPDACMWNPATASAISSTYAVQVNLEGQSRDYITGTFDLQQIIVSLKAIYVIFFSTFEYSTWIPIF